MTRVFLAVFTRDLRLAMRRRIEALLPLGFFASAIALFPLGVSPEPEVLRQIASGVLWACALLAAMLSVGQLYAGDHADGSLEQMLLSGESLVVVAGAKAAAHWVLSGVPLVLAAPVFGLMLDMHQESILTLMITLLLGTPILSLLGSLGAALTLGLRSAGVLVFLLVLPLAMPALIFGTGAVAAVENGLSPEAHLSMLGALLLLTGLCTPLAVAAALRISTE